MVDNLEIIKPFLSWENKDVFYFIQIIKRRKENPDLGSDSYVINSYFIKNLDHLYKNWEEMKTLTNYHNARVYINLNKRSFKRVAFHTLKKITDQIMNEDYINVRRAYTSVCSTCSIGEKSWIIDIDEKNIPERMIDFVNSLPPKEENKILLQVPTKNGIHLITKPFHSSEFEKMYPNINIHKDNPTILFIP